MIRRAEEKDLKDISCLLCQVQSVHAEGRPDIFKGGSRKYNDSEILSIIKDETTPVFVYEENGRVIGYSFCVIKDYKSLAYMTDRKELYIDDLCVDKSARRTGVGKALLEYTENYAKCIGCLSVTLAVWELNGSARSFYDAMGFIPLKTVMEKKM